MFYLLRHVWLTGGAPDRWFVIIIKYYVGTLVLCSPGSSGTSYSSNHDTQPDTLGRCVSDTHGTFLPASLSPSYRGAGRVQASEKICIRTWVMMNGQGVSLTAAQGAR